MIGSVTSEAETDRLRPRACATDHRLVEMARVAIVNEIPEIAPDDTPVRESFITRRSGLVKPGVIGGDDVVLLVDLVLDGDLCSHEPLSSAAPR